MTTTERPGRRLAAAAGLLLLVPALVACGDDGPDDSGDGPSTSGTGGVSSGTRSGGEPADPVSPAQRPDVAFSADVTVSDTEVRVAYRIANRTGGEVLVPNRLPDDTGAFDDDTSRAYVTGDGDGIVVAQRVFAQPDTDRMDWAQAPEVGATRLAAGETLRGAVVVPRPLERLQPYGDDLGYGTIALPEPAADVRFCVGVLVPPYPVPVADQSGVAAPVLDHGLQNAEAQYLLCSEPVVLGGGASS